MSTMFTTLEAAEQELQASISDLGDEIENSVVADLVAGIAFLSTKEVAFELCRTQIGWVPPQVSAAFADEQTAATPNHQEPRFTYYAVFSDGDQSLLDNGPHTTADSALRFAVSVLGKQMAAVMDDFRSESRVGNGLLDHVISGYTIERYADGEIDGSWSLNGGTRL